ncbi:MAG: FitA-like ribbon-helix-helix domain-containing protein [Acidimicrobiales bacterium]
MASITIRDVPDKARDELAGRAARSGRSLQEYLLRELIDLASRPDPEALAARVSARKERTATKLPGKRILRHLDVGRR